MHGRAVALRKLIGGSFAAQAIQFAAYPVLSHLAPPAVFGEYAIFFASIFLGSSLALCRLELLYLKLPDLATGRARQTMPFLFLGIAALLAPVALLQLPYVAVNASILICTWFIGTFAEALQQFCAQVSVRDERSTWIAWTRGVQIVTLVFSQYILLSRNPSIESLLLADTCSRVPVLALAILLLRQHGESRKPDYAVTDLLRTIRSEISEVTFGTAARVLSAGLGIIPQAATTLVYGTSVGGCFYLALRIALLPATLGGRNLGYLLAGDFQRHRQNNRPDIAASMIIRHVDKLAAVGFGGGLAVAVAGVCAPLVLGPGWSDTGFALIVLALPGAAHLVYVPIQNVVLLLGRARFQLVMDVAVLVANGCLYMVAWVIGFGWQTMLICFALIHTCYSLCPVFMLRRHLGSETSTC